MRGGRAAVINYRHVVHSLVKKPAAFARYRHQSQLFPRFVFRVAYDRLRETVGADADKEYLQVLQLAAQMGEETVAAALQRLIETGVVPSNGRVFAVCQSEQTKAFSPATAVAPIAVSLRAYDALLGSRDEEATR